ncbi:MAG TPA: LamG domain-containing protein [Vicinamibacterales bacterium]|jgi:hypothetical protein|nr:LamG domain-containing protein [Vicinamibacterales bacterium]
MSKSFAPIVIALWISSGAVALGQTSQSSALRFTADGQSVRVGVHPDQLDISGPLTVEAWVKPEEGILSRGYSSIVSKQLNGTGYMLATNNTANTNVDEHPFFAEMAGIQVRSRVVASIGTWQHVAAVWDGQLKIYVNGELEGIANTGPPTPLLIALYIGSSPFGDDTNWRGTIDEVRVWAVARTQAEIRSTMGRYLCGDEKGLRAVWSMDEGQGQLVFDTLTVGYNSGFMEPLRSAEWVPGVQLTRPEGCARVINDSVHLDSVQTAFTPPPANPPPEAPAGKYSILASFSNPGTTAICNPFFRIRSLATGVIRLLGVSVKQPDLGQIQGLGAEIVDHPPIVVGPGESASFEFIIGLPSTVRFEFSVDMWGTLQPLGSPCP